MIIAPAVKTLLEQNTTVKTNIGCTVEYNMNSMVDNIIVTGSEYTSPDGSKPYKKLFPASSVIKPFRPIGAGVKYGVFGDVDLNTWKDPKNIDYPLSYRTYYAGSDTYYKYWLSERNSGANVNITYPQTVLTNKIVVRFEISHSIPSTWTISKEGGSTLATGTSADIKTLTIYYNGSTWTTTEPTTLATPTSISALSLSTSGTFGLHVGVIELSPRWVADITPHIVDFSIAQESSTSPDDILPVGKVSANSMSASLISYESARKIISYEKGTAFNSSNLYMYKNVELNPYIKVYYSGAPLSDTEGNYEKVKQGTFYVNNWTTSEFGDINLDALDGAKILQDIISPGLVCKDTSAIGIIRKLLDNVGFTSYKINYKTDLTGKITDKSILSPIYWWTDDSKNVWSCIQEICRDSQMVATFDEKNILQFYTRDYLVSQTTPHWNFKYAKDGSTLPNIISLQKRDLPAANQVKILWNPTTASEFLGSAQPLWKSGSSYLGAYSLNTPLSSTSAAGDWISLSPITVNQQTNQIIYNYSGYLVIDSEIIEYDAIEYQYINKLGTITKIPIEKNSDLQKFANDVSLLIPANKAYGQTGRVRIKSRGAFGTTAAAHTAAGSGAASGWNGYNNIFKTNSSTDTTVVSSTPSNVAWSIATPPTLESTPVETTTPSVKKIQKSLFQITCDSINKNLNSVAVKNLGADVTGKYYTFGTGMFFKSTVKDVDAAGGIGFFTSNNGMTGYYVSMETTSNLADSGSDRALGIFKVVNGVKTPLTDSQNEKQKTLNYIAGSISYKVDIRVNYDSVAGAVLIDVFINNFKISALDTTNIISPTSNIAIYSSTGSAFFDYVYAVPLNEEQYKNGIMQDQYYGRFGSTTLNFLYGEKLTSNFEKSTLPGGKVDEFGTVARELRKISIKYDSRPGFPIFPSTGLSQYVEVLGSRLTSFGAEVYVLNNAGTFVELEIFSNPLISVGDLVTISYPSNGLDGTQKFIVSNVDTSFDGGINTKITTRSIYS